MVVLSTRDQCILTMECCVICRTNAVEKDKGINITLRLQSVILYFYNLYVGFNPLTLGYSTQISIYGFVCSICFANLSFHEQKAKHKNIGLKIIDN
jgi:hypothetical protein